MVSGDEHLLAALARLLVDAGRLLRSTTDPADAIREVADLCVPTLAERCIVELADDRGIERCIADTAPDRAAAVSADAWLRIPLVVRDRRVGMLALIGPERGVDERRVAEDVAHRIALAIDAVSAEAARRELLAAFSREARTPLHVIMGYADLLHAGIPEAIPEASRRHAEQIQRAAQHLLWLLEQTLHTSRRPETVSQPEHVGPADIGSLLRELAVLVEPLARARNLQISVRPPAQRTVVFTDVGHLRRILYGVFEEAFGLTKDAAVHLGARRELDEVVIEVHAGGMQLAPDWLAGAGVPLQRLAEVIGATLAVGSISGADAIVTLTVPFAWRRS